MATPEIFAGGDYSKLEERALVWMHESPPCQPYHSSTGRSVGKSEFWRLFWGGTNKANSSRVAPLYSIWIDECVEPPRKLAEMPKPPGALPSPVCEAARMALRASYDPQGLVTYLRQLDVFRQNGVL